MVNVRSEACTEENTLKVSPDIRMAFVLLNQFTLAPVSGLVESLRFAADQSFRSLQIYCKWDWMTFANQPVVASCGLTVSPTTIFDINLLKNNYDYVVLAGGLLSETRNPSQMFLDALKEIYDAKVPLIALCSGSFVLGKAGILDGRQCAVHFSIRDEFIERFPNVSSVMDKAFIEDKGVFTCPGGTAIDLAAHLIRLHCGDIRAQKGLKYLLANEDNVARDVGLQLGEQLGVYENKTVSKAIEFMSQNLSAHVTLKEVAEYAQTSPRQLHRLFIANANAPPAQYWRTLRLAYARQLLSNTNSYITTIAIKCGFADASHFTLWFKKQYGETPFSYRQRRRRVEKA